MEGLCRLCCLSHTVGHTGMLLSDHRDATQALEQDAEGEEEPLFLHQEVALHTLGTGLELSEAEVPVGGVWSQADNKLIGMVLSGPSQMLI